MSNVSGKDYWKKEAPDEFGEEDLYEELEMECVSDRGEDECILAEKLGAKGVSVNTGFEEIDEAVLKVAKKSYFTVIVYDVTDNKRRYRLAKLLAGYGERVQYSGFEGHLSMKQIEALTEKVKKVIDSKEDKVRIYKIAGKPQVKVFGSVPLIEEEEFTVI